MERSAMQIYIDKAKTLMEALPYIQRLPWKQRGPDVHAFRHDAGSICGSHGAERRGVAENGRCDIPEADVITVQDI